MAITNTAKPGVVTMTNTTRVASEFTWNNNTTTWNTETKTWLGMSTTMTNIAKPTTTITNTVKPA